MRSRAVDIFIGSGIPQTAGLIAATGALAPAWSNKVSLLGFAASALEPSQKAFQIPVVNPRIKEWNGKVVLLENKVIAARPWQSIFHPKNLASTVVFSGIFPWAAFFTSYMKMVEELEKEAEEKGDELEEFPPFPEGAVDEVLARWKLDTLLNFASQIVRNVLQRLSVKYCTEKTACRLLKDMTSSVVQKAKRLSRWELFLQAPVTAVRCNTLYAAADIIVTSVYWGYRILTEAAAQRGELFARRMVKVLTQHGIRLALGAAAVGVVCLVSPRRSSWAYNLADMAGGFAAAFLFDGPIDGAFDAIFPQPPPPPAELPGAGSPPDGDGEDPAEGSDSEEETDVEGDDNVDDGNAGAGGGGEGDGDGGPNGHNGNHGDDTPDSVADVDFNNPG